MLWLTQYNIVTGFVKSKLFSGHEPYTNFIIGHSAIQQGSINKVVKEVPENLYH